MAAVKEKKVETAPGKKLYIYVGEDKTTEKGVIVLKNSVFKEESLKKLDGIDKKLLIPLADYPKFKLKKGGR